MRSFSPIDLIAAQPWESAFFTTFSLSLAHFEAVILDALTRQDVRDNLILADVVGVRAALSEHGAQQAGRSYQIEPVAVDGGCFHPKLMALTAADDAHLVIGSGNLTVGGWGGNLECSEHLHPSFAADAFNDVVDFLEALATSPVARHAAVEACGRLAENLRRLNRTATRTGNIRVVSSLERPILDQLAEFAADFGGASRLTVASPFFDGGQALDHLCAALGISQVSVHAHGSGAVSSAMGMNWPRHTTAQVAAVTIEPLDDIRSLHAKVFEILCKRGRILMSGSVNATMAALDQGHNVELSVVRLQREPVIGWRLEAAAPLPLKSASALPDEVVDQTGVLRAEVRGDRLLGQIVTSFPIGPAVVSQLTSAGPRQVANTIVDADGCFTVMARGLAIQAWEARRLIIRIISDHNDRLAEGFVLFPEVAEINRRAGAIAGRLFSILAGTETPADVAAVMAWFFDHPEQLRLRVGGRGGEGSATDEKEITASVPDLIAAGLVDRDASHRVNAPGWHRLMDQLLACFREPRGPIDSGQGKEDPAGDDDTPPPGSHRESEEARLAFDDLYSLLLGAEGGRQDLGLALQICQYVCDRLEAPKHDVERHLTQLMNALPSAEISPADMFSLAAAVLVSVARRVAAGDQSGLRSGRRQLLRLGIDMSGAMPDMASVYCFARVLTPEFDYVTLWGEIQKSRTFQEEIRMYRLAGDQPVNAADFPGLSGLAEWTTLARPTAAQRASFCFLPKFTASCPRHHIALPSAQEDRLKRYGVAKPNCCGTLLMCEEI